MEAPKTLIEAIKLFSDYENCRQFMIMVRWADGVISCPQCQSEKVTQRIRLAMQDGFDGGRLKGQGEVDETCIGGKARNMHTAKRKKAISGRGATGKTVVMGMLERGGKVKAHVVAERE